MVLTGLMQNTHTYKNVLRYKEFCINFLSAEYYEECQKTVKCNDEDVDEVIFSCLNIEKSSIVNPPRIKEAFLSYECKLHNHDDLFGKGISAMIVGRVVNAVIEGSHDNPEELCGEKSFMYYIHAPKNPETGEGAEAGVIAALNPVRPD